MYKIIAAIVLGYALGSVPFAVIVSRLVKGIDIREVGTKNPGAANVLREVGRFWGVLVWLLDTLKGVGAMLIAHHVLEVSEAAGMHRLFWVMMAGIAAVIGHCWSVFLRFRGGRGVSTAGGVLFYVVPKAFPFCLLLYFLIQKWAPRSFWAAGTAIVFFFGLALLFYRAHLSWLGPAVAVFLVVGFIVNIPTIRETIEKRRLGPRTDTEERS